MSLDAIKKIFFLFRCTLTRHQLAYNQQQQQVSNNNLFIMVVVEYKLTISDDFRIGDNILITSRTGSGWKAMINNKFEVVFEMNKENIAPVPLDGWLLVDVNDRWEKMWVCCRENPFQIAFFKSEQDKIEKLKKNESLYLETLVHIEELEVVQANNPHNPPIVSFISLLYHLLSFPKKKKTIFEEERDLCLRLKTEPLTPLSQQRMVW